MNSLFC